MGFALPIHPSLRANGVRAAIQELCGKYLNWIAASGVALLAMTGLHWFFDIF
jgi:hypothetical protein